MSRFDYVRPGSVDEAIGLLNDPAHTGRPLAGDTDLVVLLRHQEPGFDRLVDISTLPELKEISRRGDTITLGACVTFSEATESQLLQEAAPLLAKACRFVGGPQIRNLGTIGGNVANAAACADSLAVLVCLEATAHLRGPRGERAVPVTGFVLGPNRTQIAPGELLTHFSFDVPPPGTKTFYYKVGRRKAQAISRLTMAAMGRLDAEGVIDFVRITPGSATPQTVRFVQVEDMLLGQQPTDELLAAAGRRVAEVMISITGRRWSTEYKEPVIVALAERALRHLFAS